MILITTTAAAALLLLCSHHAIAAEATPGEGPLDSATVETWSAPYRNWHYYPDHVIPAEPRIPGFEAFHNTDVPTVYQLPADDRWYMSFLGFDGRGYNSFVAESDDLIRMVAFSRDLVHWTADPVPLYKAGGNPSGLDATYAHKISLAYNLKNGAFYLFYCAVGNKGRGIGLLTSKPVAG